MIAYKIILRIIFLGEGMLTQAFINKNDAKMIISIYNMLVLILLRRLNIRTATAGMDGIANSIILLLLRCEMFPDYFNV